ncbi:MAG: NTP transferase domain-containing protein [Gemmatimonadaceae bacterium]|nr:NTP transferase domain-containing protein [Gemmatimonadaceae bacterium]
MVLAGGVGSRFWPLSTPDRPKQLLPLVDDKPLLVNTLLRLEPIVSADRTLILTNASLVDAIRAAVPSIPGENVIAEPRPAGTAAALAWAATEIDRRSDADSTMICVHADWAVADAQGFRDALLAAETVAIADHALVTVGIVPTRPDPGFGYLQPGAITDSGAREVTRFVEKPDRKRAAEMLEEGYLWNSGIFVWRVRDFLAEVMALTPEISASLTAHGRNTGGMAAFFAEVKQVSVDVGVMERSARVRVVSGDFGWDDVGTWEALRRVKAPDESGNVANGSLFALEASRNVVHAEGAAVVLYGVSDLVVISRGGLTLVTTTEKSADLKTLIDALPAELRDLN